MELTVKGNVHEQTEIRNLNHENWDLYKVTFFV